MPPVFPFQLLLHLECYNSQLSKHFQALTSSKSAEHEFRNRKHQIGAFEHEGDGIAAVVSLDGDDVIISGAPEHLGHVAEVHTHGDVAVASVVLEALRSEKEGNECHVAEVHDLKGEVGGRVVEVGVVHQVLDRLQHLLQ
ncbi:hypothetical protein COP2_035808 [Malus domestica]